MGKFFSKFKSNKSSLNSNNNDNDNNKIEFSDIQKGEFETKKSSFNSKILNNKMTNQLTIKLKEKNNFQEFENVLCVSCGLNSTCLFGLNDNVIYCKKINRYLSASRDKSIKLWNMSNDHYELDMNDHELSVTALTTDPTNNFVISGSRDNNLNLWNLENGKLISKTNISRNLITDAYWSTDGKILIQSSEDKEVRLWDPYNLKLIFSFPKKQYIQSSCHISNDNNYAISTSNGFQGNGCEITVFDLRNRKILNEMFGHEQTVTSAKFIKSDKYIASCSNDSTVRLWDTNKFEQIDTIFLNGSLTSISESFGSENLIVSSILNGIFKIGF